jgi:hypothetical protein
VINLGNAVGIGIGTILGNLFFGWLRRRRAARAKFNAEWRRIMDEQAKRKELDDPAKGRPQ